MTLARITLLSFPLLVTLFIGGCAGHSSSQSTMDGRWAFYQGSHEGSPVIVRRNNEAERHADGDSAYHYRLFVAIGLNDPDANGFPKKQESETLYDIEDQFIEALSNTDSVISHVLTTGGMRQIVFYTSEPERVTGIIESLKSSVQSHQWGYDMDEDKNWSLYHSVGS